MAIDPIARGMAAGAGGGGGVDVGIDAGTGIRFTGTDPITIINTGVTAVTTPGDNDALAEDGTIKVANPGAENSADRVHYVKVKGINNAAFKDVDTVINDTKATSTNVPTTKAVYDELEKKLEADLDTTAFTNDNDHVPSSKLVKEKLDDKLEDSLTINGVSYDSTNDSYTLDGDDIDLTGYTPISSGSEEDVAATDSVNDAVAKIEYKADNRIPTDNIDADFPVSPDATHVLASTIASATFQGTGTAGVAPKKGLVPAPSTISGDETRYLKADGTWATPPNSEYSEGTGINISNAGVISNVGVTHIENSDPADDNVGNGTFKVTENGTDKWIAIKGLDDAAYMEVVTSIPATPLDTNLPTSQAVAEYVDDAIDALPKPMVFKGGITLTADSTDTTLCSLTLPSGITTIKEGYTFKVVAIASNPVYTGNIKVGDTLYADKDNAKTTADWVVDTDWTITPSGDEPSGTVTEITASDGIIAYDNATHGSSISDNGNIKLALVTNHTTTANAGDASSTADRSYPLALDGNGKLATNVPWTDTTYEFADSYNASTNKGATVATVTNAIEALDVSGTTTFGAGKTISSWSETDGKVSITSQDISITGSQISDIDTSMPTTAVDTKVPSTKLVKTQLSGKQDTLTFDGTYNASTNKAATVSTVTNAINALDVAAVPVGATKTLTSISQTDGKISATATDIQSASTSQKGLVQLNDTLVSTSTTLAATANAVKAVNDKAETNKSNILYGINNGVKNICDYINPLQLNNCEIVDGEFKQIVTDSKANLQFMASSVRSDGTTYAMFTSVTITANGEYSYEFNFPSDAVAIRIGHNGTTRDAKFDINTDHFVVGTTYVISINVLNCVQSSGVFRFNKIMICTKQLWDTIGHDFMPPALPNYDLTRLEAEDRAALAEEIDAGAKQLANFTSTTNLIVNSNGYTIAVSGKPSSTANQWIWQGQVSKSGYYAFVVEGTSIPTTVLYNATDDTNVLLYNTSSGGKSIGYLSTGKTYKIGAYLNSSTTYNTSFNCMLCTNAAFGVSKAFVPYRPPYDFLERKPYQIQITSESVLNDLPEGTVTGNLETMIAGISAGQWTTVQTIDLNTSTGSTRRRMQVLMDSYGRVAGRLYTNNAWTQWSYGRDSAVKIFERTTSGNETINNVSPYGSFQLVAFNNSTSGTYSTTVPRELITNGMKIAVVEAGGNVIASVQRSGQTTTYVCTVTSGYSMIFYGY